MLAQHTSQLYLSWKFYLGRCGPNLECHGMAWCHWHPWPGLLSESAPSLNLCSLSLHFLALIIITIGRIGLALFQRKLKKDSWFSLLHVFSMLDLFFETWKEKVCALTIVHRTPFLLYRYRYALQVSELWVLHQGCRPAVGRVNIVDSTRVNVFNKLCWASQKVALVSKQIWYRTSKWTLAFPHKMTWDQDRNEALRQIS